MEAVCLQLSWRRAVVAVVGTLSGFFVCICEKLRAGENLNAENENLTCNCLLHIHAFMSTVFWLWFRALSKLPKCG